MQCGALIDDECPANRLSTPFALPHSAMKKFSSDQLLFVLISGIVILILMLIRDVAL